MKTLKYQIFKSKDITHIYGMSTLALLKYENKIVYVFGEEHTPYYDCDEYSEYVVKARIDEFILYILETNFDKMIDIYTEEEYISSNNERIREKENRYFGGRVDKGYAGSGLDYILLTFKDCLSFVKNCEYENVRFHYTDMRDLFNYTRNILEKIDEIENSDDLLLNEKINELNDFLDIINYDSEEILNKILFYKQLEKIDEDLALKLEKIAKRKITQFPKKDGRLRKFVKEIGDYFNNYMDLYLVARMLKGYAENIMIFAGDSHSQNIISILEEIGFKKEIEYKKDYKQCIDLSDFPLPFFTD
jgi:hypothetical protein